MGLKTYLQRRFLKKESESLSRIKVMKNLMEMKSILVLCSVKTVADWEKWNTYFKNMASHMNQIDVVAFINTKEKLQLSANYEKYLILPSDISYFGKAKDIKKLSNFVDYKYDLLIDLNVDDIFIINWIYAKSASSLKVGYHGKDHFQGFYDLIINTAEANKKQKLYIDQVFYFLRQINQNGNK